MAATTRTSIQARFGDYDIFGHVNNVSQQQYLDIGRIAFITEHICSDMFDQSLKVILVSVNMDFVDQLFMGTPVEVVTELESVGTKSIRLRQTLLRKEGDTEIVCTRSTSVLVAWDTASQSTVAVPDEWRTNLTK
ncbi:MAG: acyl-CoA thioesterase [Rikenellaceae bacterium]|nr:acyl-CoA thioesterase [Rikenellaceae bacterium]